jgi:hypothetical protein
MTEGWNKTTRIDVEEGLWLRVGVYFHILIRDLLVF